MPALPAFFTSVYALDFGKYLSAQKISAGILHLALSRRFITRFFSLGRCFLCRAIQYKRVQPQSLT